MPADHLFGAETLAFALLLLDLSALEPRFFAFPLTRPTPFEPSHPALSPLARRHETVLEESSQLWSARLAYDPYSRHDEADREAACFLLMKQST